LAPSNIFIWVIFSLPIGTIKYIYLGFTLFINWHHQIYLFGLYSLYQLAPSNIFIWVILSLPIGSIKYNYLGYTLFTNWYHQIHLFGLYSLYQLPPSYIFIWVILSLPIGTIKYIYLKLISWNVWRYCWLTPGIRKGNWKIKIPLRQLNIPFLYVVTIHRH
jgi:hypothetical protein